MKKKFVFVFLNKESISAYFYDGAATTPIVTTCNIEDTHVYLDVFSPYKKVPFILFASFENSQVKTFDLSGFNLLHTHQLTQRIKKDYGQFDWFSLWQNTHTLTLLYGYFTENEKSFLQTLANHSFQIYKVVSNIQILDELILNGHTIQQSGIATLPLNNAFEHVLYVNDKLTFLRSSFNGATLDWEEFMQDKHNVSIATLNVEKIICLQYSNEANFVTFCTKNFRLSKSIYLNKLKGLFRTYRYLCLLRSASVAFGGLGLLMTTFHLPNWIELHTKFDSLSKLSLKVQDYTHQLQKSFPQGITTIEPEKQATFDTFEQSKFPTLSLLEKLSAILPNYGKVISLKLETNMKEFNPKANIQTYALTITLTPFHNSKQMSLLNSELTQKFGKSLRITTHLNQKNNLQLSTLNKTVTINIVGIKDELLNQE